MDEKGSTRYAVDIDAGNKVVDDIREAVESTHDDNVVSEWGSFAGCMRLKPIIKAYDDPVLVSSVDSVGSKILLALQWNQLDEIGTDLVHHCINDILVQGAFPTAFLDYVACGRLDPSQATRLVKSIASACKYHGIRLMGGETAEIRDMYRPGAMDIAGTILGMAERSEIPQRNWVQPDDLVYAQASNGFHTNGFTMVLDYLDQCPENIQKQLLEPHPCYKNSIARLMLKDFPIHGMVHITGGGLVDNPTRALPPELSMHFDRTWKIPDVIQWIIQASGMTLKEARRTFNMGLGFLIIVPHWVQPGDDWFRVGHIEKRQADAVVFEC